MNGYEQKQERRRERLQRAAARAQTEAEASTRRGVEMLQVIPVGQPILIGHHSEGRHRALIKRSDNAMRKGSRLYDEAKEYAERAAAVGTGGISSDDPEALAKLTEQLEAGKAQREHMNAVNAAFRRKRSDVLEQLTGKTLEQWTAAVAGNHSWDKRPFASYTITNLGANLRRIDQRIKSLAARNLDAAVKVEEYTGAEQLATITIDEAGNRVSLKFSQRLSREDYKHVRGAGFVWARSMNAFTRKYGGHAIDRARELAQRFTGEQFNDAARCKINGRPVRVVIREEELETAYAPDPAGTYDPCPHCAQTYCNGEDCDGAAADEAEAEGALQDEEDRRAAAGEPPINPPTDEELRARTPYPLFCTQPAKCAGHGLCQRDWVCDD